MLSGGTQRLALPLYQNEENIKFPPVGIEPSTCRINNHTLRPLRQDRPKLTKKTFKINITKVDHIRTKVDHIFLEYK